MLARSLLVGAVAAAAAVLIGCGSSGGSDSSVPLSKSEFVIQADAACKKAVTQVSAGLESLPAESGGSTGTAQIPGGTEVVSSAFAPAMSGMTEELASLSPPRKDRAEVRAIVSAFEKGVRQAESNPEAALAKSPFTSAGELASAYGMKECSF